MADTTTTSSTTTTTSNNMWSGGVFPSLMGGLTAFKAYKEFTRPSVNYDILNAQAEYKDLKAMDIENKVEQEANKMRENFIGAVGDYRYGQARRGVKVGGGGSGDQNVEASSRDLGFDIQTLRGNAKFKGDQLRMEADRLRAGAEGAREVDKWNNMAKGFSTLSSATDWFKRVDFSSTTETEKETVDGDMPDTTGEKDITTPPSVDVETKTTTTETTAPDKDEPQLTDSGGRSKNKYDDIGADFIFREGKEPVDKRDLANLSDDKKRELILDLKREGKSEKLISKLLGRDQEWVASYLKDEQGSFASLETLENELGTQIEDPKQIKNLIERKLYNAKGEEDFKKWQAIYKQYKKNAKSIDKDMASQFRTRGGSA